MKKFLLSLILALTIPLPDFVMQAKGPLIILSKVPETKDPCLPVSVTISCFYSAGVLTFSLPSEIQFATVLITSETGELWSGMVTQDYPSVEISELPGDQTITLIDDNGIEYTGDISFE